MGVKIVKDNSKVTGRGFTRSFKVFFEASHL